MLNKTKTLNTRPMHMMILKTYFIIIIYLKKQKKRE